MSTPLINPTLTNGVPDRGHTRIAQGGLEYLDKAGDWRPAVRHHTVRHLLIQQAACDGSYTYPRQHGKDAADQTSFLRQDQDYGYDWDNRPPVLFQLFPGDEPYSHKPCRSLMFGSRVLLDPYDHPIRDFPELPLTLCFSEKGLFIEYYLRLNREIKPYDLMARMGLNSKKKPARVYTIVERATKFRQVGLCLSWRKKVGSDEIMRALLNLLPPGATSSYSFGRDLTKAESDALRVGNKGLFPNRRRKAVREAEARLSAPSNSSMASGLPMFSHTTGASGFPISATSPVSMAPTVATEIAPSKIGQKRRHTATELDLEADSSSPRASKSRRLRGNLDFAGPSYSISELVVKKRGFDHVTHEHEDSYFANADPKRRKLTSSYGGLTNYTTASELGNHNASALEGKYTAICEGNSIVHQYASASGTPTRDDNGNCPWSQELDLTDFLSSSLSDHAYPHLDAKLGHDSGHRGYNEAYRHSREKRGRYSPGPKGAPITAMPSESINPALLNPYSDYSSSLSQRIDISWSRPGELHRLDVSTSADISDVDYHNSQRTGDGSHSQCHGENPAPPSFDPSCPEYQIESNYYQNRGDFRYVDPITDEEIATVFNKVQLARMDFIIKMGPGHDPGYDYEHESYMSQLRRLQDKFTHMWKGPGQAPGLYGCHSEEWSNGFASWLIMDEEGLNLLELINTAEMNHECGHDSPNAY